MKATMGTQTMPEAGQLILTVIAWAGTLAGLIYALLLSRHRREPLAVMIFLAAALGSSMEPLWDHVFSLHWRSSDAWTVYRAYGVGQPTWVVPVYAIVYGLGTLAALEVLQRRPGPYRIHHIWIAASIAIATIEFVAISCGVYNYEGHQELLVAGRYPAWCALLEGGCVAVWAALVAGARPSLTGARSILVAPLFAAVFAAIMYGAGTPALVADNLGANDLVGTTACLLVVLLCLGIVSSAGELFEKATTVRSTVLSSVTEAAKEHSAEWAATAHHVSRSEEIGSSR